MADRLLEGLEMLGLEMPESIIEKELYFLDELLRWNQRVNLTSISDRDMAIEKHLLDSLILLHHLETSIKIMDVGSGGGFPGIPLAIAGLSLQVVSIDSLGKKVNFQKHIKRLLQLDNLTVVQSRIEKLEQFGMQGGKHDLVVSRAFSVLDVFIPVAAPWLRPGGRLLAMKGPEGDTELAAAAQVLEKYNFTDPQVVRYRLPFSHAERQLISFEKLPDNEFVNK